MQNTARNATLADLEPLLKAQQARKIDVVAPAAKLRAEGGNIVVAGVEPIITDDGVTLADGTYRPTAVFDEGVSEKLGIPLAYMRRMRNERPDLYDANVNGWLHGTGEGITLDPDTGVISGSVPDQRSFFVRGFKGSDGTEGIARALLSDSYRVVDHLDALMAALSGVQSSGVEVNVYSADLTDRRMVVRVAAPSVQALAPVLLEGYRSPFGGASGTDNPVVFGGFEIANSETGGGAFTITPRLVVQICTNGMKITRDALRAIHVGGRMEEGVVRWSEETQRKNLELITVKARDAVATFLDVAYVERAVRRLDEAAGRPIEHPETEVREVTKKLAFTEEQIDSVFAHFIRGGQMTVGGVANAITAYAQEVTDGDEAYELENAATRLLGV